MVQIRLAVRRAVNVTLPVQRVARARELKINVSAACETGLEAAIQVAEAQAWRRDNADAIQAYNEFVETKGILLEQHRQF